MNIDTLYIYPNDTIDITQDISYTRIINHGTLNIHETNIDTYQLDNHGIIHIHNNSKVTISPYIIFDISNSYFYNHPNSIISISENSSLHIHNCISSSNYGLIDISSSNSSLNIINTEFTNFNIIQNNSSFYINNSIDNKHPYYFFNHHYLIHSYNSIFNLSYTTLYNYKLCIFDDYSIFNINNNSYIIHTLPTSIHIQLGKVNSNDGYTNRIIIRDNASFIQSNYKYSDYSNYITNYKNKIVYPITYNNNEFINPINSSDISYSYVLNIDNTNTFIQDNILFVDLHETIHINKYFIPIFTIINLGTIIIYSPLYLSNSNYSIINLGKIILYSDIYQFDTNKYIENVYSGKIQTTQINTKQSLYDISSIHTNVFLTENTITYPISIQKPQVYIINNNQTIHIHNIFQNNNILINYGTIIFEGNSKYINNGLLYNYGEIQIKGYLKNNNNIYNFNILDISSDDIETTSLSYIFQATNNINLKSSPSLTIKNNNINIQYPKLDYFTYQDVSFSIYTIPYTDFIFNENEYMISQISRNTIDISNIGYNTLLINTNDTSTNNIFFTNRGVFTFDISNQLNNSDLSFGILFSSNNFRINCCLNTLHKNIHYLDFDYKDKYENQLYSDNSYILFDSIPSDLSFSYTLDNSNVDISIQFFLYNTGTDDIEYISNHLCKNISDETKFIIIPNEYNVYITDISYHSDPNIIFSDISNFGSITCNTSISFEQNISFYPQSSLHIQNDVSLNIKNTDTTFYNHSTIFTDNSSSIVIDSSNSIDFNSTIKPTSSIPKNIDISFISPLTSFSTYSSIPDNTDISFHIDSSNVYHPSLLSQYICDSSNQSIQYYTNTHNMNYINDFMFKQLLDSTSILHKNIIIQNDECLFLNKDTSYNIYKTIINYGNIYLDNSVSFIIYNTFINYGNIILSNPKATLYIKSTLLDNSQSIYKHYHIPHKNNKHNYILSYGNIIIQNSTFFNYSLIYNHHIIDLSNTILYNYHRIVGNGKINNDLSSNIFTDYITRNTSINKTAFNNTLTNKLLYTNQHLHLHLHYSLLSYHFDDNTSTNKIFRSYHENIQSNTPSFNQLDISSNLSLQSTNNIKHKLFYYKQSNAIISLDNDNKIQYSYDHIHWSSITDPSNQNLKNYYIIHDVSNNNGLSYIIRYGTGSEHLCCSGNLHDYYNPYTHMTELSWNSIPDDISNTGIYHYIKDKTQSSDIFTNTYFYTDNSDQYIYDISNTKLNVIERQKYNTSDHKFYYDTSYTFISDLSHITIFDDTIYAIDKGGSLNFHMIDKDYDNNDRDISGIIDTYVSNIFYIPYHYDLSNTEHYLYYYDNNLSIKKIPKQSNRNILYEKKFGHYFDTSYHYIHTDISLNDSQISPNLSTCLPVFYTNRHLNHERILYLHDIYRINYNNKDIHFTFDINTSTYVLEKGIIDISSNSKLIIRTNERLYVKEGGRINMNGIIICEESSIIINDGEIIHMGILYNYGIYENYGYSIHKKASMFVNICSIINHNSIYIEIGCIFKNILTTISNRNYGEIIQIKTSERFERYIQNPCIYLFESSRDFNLENKSSYKYYIQLYNSKSNKIYKNITDISYENIHHILQDPLLFNKYQIDIDTPYLEYRPKTNDNPNNIITDLSLHVFHSKTITSIQNDISNINILYNNKYNYEIYDTIEHVIYSKRDVSDNDISLNTNTDISYNVYIIQPHQTIRYDISNDEYDTPYTIINYGNLHLYDISSNTKLNIYNYNNLYIYSSSFLNNSSSSIHLDASFHFHLYNYKQVYYEKYDINDISYDHFQFIIPTGDNYSYIQNTTEYIDNSFHTINDYLNTYYDYKDNSNILLSDISLNLFKSFDLSDTIIFKDNQNNSKSFNTIYDNEIHFFNKMKNEQSIIKNVFSDLSNNLNTNIILNNIDRIHTLITDISGFIIDNSDTLLNSYDICANKYDFSNNIFFNHIIDNSVNENFIFDYSGSDLTYDSSFIQCLYQNEEDNLSNFSNNIKTTNDKFINIYPIYYNIIYNIYYANVLLKNVFNNHNLKDISNDEFTTINTDLSFSVSEFSHISFFRFYRFIYNFIYLHLKYLIHIITTYTSIHVNGYRHKTINNFYIYNHADISYSNTDISFSFFDICNNIIFNIPTINPTNTSNLNINISTYIQNYYDLSLSSILYELKDDLKDIDNNGKDVISENITNEIERIYDNDKVMDKWYTLIDISVNNVKYNMKDKLLDDNMYVLLDNVDMSKNEYLVIDDGDILDFGGAKKSLTITNSILYYHGQLKGTGKIELTNSIGIFDNSDILYDDYTTLDISLSNSTCYIPSLRDKNNKKINIDKDDNSIVISSTQYSIDRKNMNKIKKRIEYKNISDIIQDKKYEYEENNLKYTIYYGTDIHIDKNTNIRIHNNERLILYGNSKIDGNIINEGELYFGDYNSYDISYIQSNTYYHQENEQFNIYHNVYTSKTDSSYNIEPIYNTIYNKEIHHINGYIYNHNKIIVNTYTILNGYIMEYPQSNIIENELLCSDIGKIHDIKDIHPLSNNDINVVYIDMNNDDIYSLLNHNSTTIDNTQLNTIQSSIITSNSDIYTDTIKYLFLNSSTFNLFRKKYTNEYNFNIAFHIKQGQHLQVYNFETININSNFDNSGVIHLYGTLQFENNFKINNHGEIILYNTGYIHNVENIVNTSGKIIKIFSNYFDIDDNNMIKWYRSDFKFYSVLRFRHYNKYTFEYNNIFNSKYNFKIEYKSLKYNITFTNSNRNNELIIKHVGDIITINGYMIHFISHLTFDIIKSDVYDINLSYYEDYTQDEYYIYHNQINDYILNTTDEYSNTQNSIIKNVLHNEDATIILKESSNSEIVLYPHLDTNEELAQPYVSAVNIIDTKMLQNKEAIIQLLSNQRIRITLICLSDDCTKYYKNNPSDVYDRKVENKIKNAKSIHTYGDKFLVKTHDDKYFIWGKELYFNDDDNKPNYKQYPLKMFSKQDFNLSNISIVSSTDNYNNSVKIFNDIIREFP
jgi:hypothetical protein